MGLSLQLHSCLHTYRVEKQLWAMAVKMFSPRLILCIAAFAPFCFGSPKGRLAERAPLTQLNGAQQWSNVSLPFTQAPPPDPSSTLSDMTPTSTCSTYSPCNLFYQVSHTALLPLL